MPVRPPQYITEYYGVGYSEDAEGNRSPLTDEQMRFYDKALARSMSQTKEMLAAPLMPDGPPWWETPDPRGGFHERKRLRCKKDFDDLFARGKRKKWW